MVVISRAARQMVVFRICTCAVHPRQISKGLHRFADGVSDTVGRRLYGWARAAIAGIRRVVDGVGLRLVQLYSRLAQQRSSTA